MKKKFLLPLILFALPIASCSMDGFFKTGTNPNGDNDEIETITITKVEIISATGKMKVTYDSPRINPFKYPGLSFLYLTVNGETLGKIDRT